MEQPDVTFTNRAFCFTGKLCDLKRTAAEREVRARGGLTLDHVNERLDYLVVGDQASPAWKFGTYGRKIEVARELRQGGAKRPELLSEASFVECLACTPCTNSGAIDEKIVVCMYKVLLASGEVDYDQDAVEVALARVHNQYGCHVSVRTGWAVVHRDLFGEQFPANVSTGALVVEYRLIRHQALDAPTSDFVNAVAQAFEQVPDFDGALRWFERPEGSAGFIRLLQELPQSTRVVV